MTTAGRLHTGLSSIAIFLYFDAFSPFTIMRVAPISSHMIELPPISSISHARRLSARRWTFLEVALLLKNAQKKTDEYLLENLLEKTAGIGGNEPTLNTRTLLRMMRVSTPASVVRAMSEQHVDWAYDMVLFSSILQYILNVQKWAAPLSDRVTRVAPCMNALLPPPPSAL